MASLRFNLPAHTNFNPCSSQCSFLSHRQFRSNDYLFVANVLFPSSPPKKYALHSASRNSRKLGFVSRRRGNSVGVRCTSDISSTEDDGVEISRPRRSLLVLFNCDACGTRTRRVVNRLAYERGTVFVQCAGCESYHKLVDNLGLITEYDFRNDLDTPEQV
eukprot:TRINITY_DN366_c0_g1_i2.p1 TRINITY_DN366_c0_g1~~TRINITY_DN366_c0_g1_i2.p1  ORF type:complete len:161 (+),score=9.01 TRINITY_DN366_c0_g1_i2:167-649(+)